MNQAAYGGWIFYFFDFQVEHQENVTDPLDFFQSDPPIVSIFEYDIWDENELEGLIEFGDEVSRAFDNFLRRVDKLVAQFLQLLSLWARLYLAIWFQILNLTSQISKDFLNNMKNKAYFSWIYLSKEWYDRVSEEYEWAHLVK